MGRKFEYNLLTWLMKRNGAGADEVGDMKK
jgi:hypothetical protein